MRFRSVQATTDRILTIISHRAFSADSIVNESDGSPTSAKLVYQLDYVDSVSSQTVKLLDQDDIAGQSGDFHCVRCSVLTIRCDSIPST